MKQEQINDILEKHKLWLDDSPEGERANFQVADLKGANLERANLYGADLREVNFYMANLNGVDFEGADLDYSCWPLSCRTKDVKLCKKLQAQLLAHAFQVAHDCVLPDQVHQFIKDNFHRYDDFFSRGQQ